MLVSGDFQIFRWRSEKKLSHFPHLYPLVLSYTATRTYIFYRSPSRDENEWDLGVWAAVWYGGCGVVCGVWAPFGPWAEH